MRSNISMYTGEQGWVFEMLNTGYQNNTFYNTLLRETNVLYFCKNFFSFNKRSSQMLNVILTDAAVRELWLNQWLPKGVLWQYSFTT